VISGSQLGPYGSLVTLGLTGGGSLTVVFASLLQRTLPPGYVIGPGLLVVRGFGTLLAAAFLADVGPVRTAGGYLHVIGFFGPPPCRRRRSVPKRLPRARTLKGEPKLAHYDSGGGASGEPPIVLLHQSLARSEDWENIFPRLATRYRAIAYDARGHGKSGRAADYSLRAF